VLEKAAELRDEMSKSQDVTYLRHEAACVRLQDGTAINVFGSPLSRKNGPWAFGYADEDGDGLWANVDETKKLDILISHGPALGLCDSDSHGQADGSAALLRALERVRPRLVVCGHRHEGRGSVEVAWGSSGSHAVRRWRDPGGDSGRLSLVDLTRPSTGHREAAWADNGRLTTESQAGSGSRLRITTTADAATHWEEKGEQSKTCVVNAAIVAKSHGQPQSSFNKPMVVDVELWSGTPESGQVAQ
jgi:hypothetical protein